MTPHELIETIERLVAKEDHEGSGTLTFKLPSQQTEFLRASRATSLAIALWDIEMVCRENTKYDVPADECLVKIRDILTEVYDVYSEG